MHDSTLNWADDDETPAQCHHWVTNAQVRVGPKSLLLKSSKKILSQVVINWVSSPGPEFLVFKSVNKNKNPESSHILRLPLVMCSHSIEVEKRNISCFWSMCLWTTLYEPRGCCSQVNCDSLKFRSSMCETSPSHSENAQEWSQVLWNPDSNPGLE